MHRSVKRKTACPGAVERHDQGGWQSSRKGVCGRVLLGACLLLAASLPVAAQDVDLDGGGAFNKGGRTALQFLKIGLGARQAALGEASIAAVRDVNAVFWNPAGLAGIARFEASFSYVRWLADLNYVAGTVGARWDRVGVFALSVAALDYGDIDEALVTSPTGGNDTRTGNTFSGSDLLVGLTYTRAFTDRLALGVTAKYIREDLFTGGGGCRVTGEGEALDCAAATFAFDVGTNYDLRYNGLRLAMSAQNFGGSVDYLGEAGSRSEGFDIPLLFRIGLAADLAGAQDAFVALGPMHRVTVMAEAINTNDFSERLHVGAEYWFGGFLALRGGYRFNYAEGNLALGFGLDTGVGDLAARLDYAYVNYAFLDAPHRFSLTLAL